MKRPSLSDERGRTEFEALDLLEMTIPDIPIFMTSSCSTYLAELDSSDGVVASVQFWGPDSHTQHVGNNQHEGPSFVALGRQANLVIESGSGFYCSSYPRRSREQYKYWGVILVMVIADKVA